MWIDLNQLDEKYVQNMPNPATGLPGRIVRLLAFPQKRDDKFFIVQGVPRHIKDQGINGNICGNLEYPNGCHSIENKPRVEPADEPEPRPVSRYAVAESRIEDSYLNNEP